MIGGARGAESNTERGVGTTRGAGGRQSKDAGSGVVFSLRKGTSKRAGFGRVDARSQDGLAGGTEAPNNGCNL